LSKVIFTNGCFDIVHRGHVELLEYCKSIGDKVIVGLNSDDSVKRLKGKKRPINSEKDRKYLLESLKYVDEVVIFNEDTPIKLIEKLNPDVIVKGGDYTVESVVGNNICEVRIFKYVKGYSTTSTIQDINNR
jgi:D-beta-D-heptose 7-phosphate kinase/D-beta-D-heptose 1-phosphate adenosyltransferase